MSFVNVEKNTNKQIKPYC